MTADENAPKPQRPEPGAVELGAGAGGSAIVGLSGECDLTTRDALADALRRASDQPGTVVLVDLSECSFIDSTVIGAIALSHKALAEQGRRLELVIPPMVAPYAASSSCPDFRPSSRSTSRCRQTEDAGRGADAELRDEGKPALRGCRLEPRDLDTERGADTDLALNRNHAIVSLGDGFHDREAQTAATSAVCGASAIEAIEDVRQLVGRDAGALIAHLEHETPAATRGGQRDDGAVMGMAQRVLDEIVE